MRDFTCEKGTNASVCFGFHFTAFYFTLSGKVTIISIYHFSLEKAYFTIGVFSVRFAFVYFRSS